ncbi:MAG TPA: endonuclease III [Bacillota bacterium]|nr:endonuclease III [Bacillota bacterium]
MFSRNHEEAEAKRIHTIFTLLEQLYPGAQTALHFANPFQLLVATVLSAQTTDEQVNRITAKLFPRAGSPEKLARMERAELERYLQGCGLFRQKSRFLIEASRIIVEKHGGKVPDTFEALVALPGVGRKTANVILSNAFNKPALAVDTHVFRVARRLGLAAGKKVEQVEEELKALLPPHEWGRVHHRLIAHGRRICKALQPQCGDCLLGPCCPSRHIRS